MAVTNGFSRMPPLASSEIDPVHISLVTNWIAELTGWRTYDEWRIEHFGDTNAPAGERGEDPNEDGEDNETEFLTYGDPTNGLDTWSGGIGSTGGTADVGYALFNRRVFVEYSTNLVDWCLWQVEGNDGIPLAPGVTRSIPLPQDDPAGNFRFQIEEN